MLHTLIFGAPVRSQNTQFGTLKRVILNNGIANQITVDPGLIGVERIVPISAVPQTTTDAVQLNATDDEWKAFAAYQFHGIFANSNEDEPSLQVIEAAETVGAGIGSATGTHDSTSPLGSGSIPLTAHTTVTHAGQDHTLKGVIVDTGRPHQLVLDNDQIVDAALIQQITSDRIELGGTPTTTQ